MILNSDFIKTRFQLSPTAAPNQIKDSRNNLSLVTQLPFEELEEKQSLKYFTEIGNDDIASSIRSLRVSTQRLVAILTPRHKGYHKKNQTNVIHVKGNSRTLFSCYYLGFDYVQFSLSLSLFF